MQKTINKLWLVMTLSIICVFCFCGFSKLAHDNASRALKRIEAIEQRFEALVLSDESIDSRLVKLEQSIDEIRSMISVSSTQLRQGPNDLATQKPGTKKQLNAAVGNARKSNSEIHSTIDSFDEDISHFPSIFPGLGVTKDMDEVLLDFRESLDEDALLELDNRIELKLQGNMQRGLELAAEQMQMSAEQREQVRQVFEGMPQEELDLLRAAQEKSVLVEMMLENAQPTIEASQRLIEQYDLEEARRRAMDKIKSNSNL
jgi:hypothetical protein